MADYDIFREQLGIRYPAYGHALWDPSPNDPERPVEVGDVGFIRRGKFHRLFNALLPADDESQDLGVPEYYERLVPNLKDRHISKGSLSRNHYCSAGVHATAELDCHSSGPDDFKEVSFRYSERRGGAVLSLPVKAQREDTLAQSAFGEWMVKHIDRLFAFAQQFELGIEQMEEIILVTGCDRSRSWANIVFLGGPGQASFGVKVVHSLDTNTNIQFSPGHFDGALLNQGPEGKNLPEDQCVFIRGFRVTRTFKIFPKRLKAAAGPSSEPEGYDCEPDAELISVPATPKYRDPLHVLLDYIAEAPDCDMALIHDNDLGRIDGIGEGTSLDSLQPEVVMDLFRESNMEIHKVHCDLSPVNSSPTTDTGVICVAMLSMLSKNWNIALPFQLLSNVAQNPGPSQTSESPTPFPPTLSHGSSVAPIQGDINIRDGTILRRLWHAAKYFVTLVVQGLRNSSLCLGIILPALSNIRYSVSDLWRSLRKFAHEQRHRLVPTVVITFCAVLFLGWIFSLTWLAISKLFVTLLLSILIFALLFEREHMRRQLDEMYEKIEVFQHHVTSNPAVPGLVAEAQNIIPVTAKTVPPKTERLRQRMQAEPPSQKNTGNTVEQSTTINLDGIPEQRARQPGISTESASSHWSLIFLAMKKHIEQLSAGTSLLRQPEVVQRIPSNLVALRRSGVRLLMCCASLSAADFASPTGYFGPSASTLYYPTGDIEGDRNIAFTSAMDCLDAMEILLVGNHRDAVNISVKQSELAQALYDLGLHEYASMTSGFALELARDMYAAVPDDFRLHVASIQSLRANILVNLKQNEEAVRAADEAVALYKEHGRLQGVPIPELTYARLDQAVLLCSIGLKEDGAGLSFKLLNEADESWKDSDKKYISALCQLCLSNACVEIDSDLALSVAEEVIDHYHDRGQLDPNFRAVLAGALLTKSKILSTKGQHDKAYVLSSQAVDLLRVIRVERPVFSLILAHALDTYSRQLLGANRDAESYQVAQEAVELWKAMRSSAPGAITRPLAWALFHLAKFRRKDGDKDALLVSESAVDMFREVSPLDAAALADALYLLADRMLELDKKHEAAVYAEESVRYFQEAASQAPDKYALDLIFSLSLASSCLASVARTDDALEYGKQAVEAQRERMGAVEYDVELRKLLMDVVLLFVGAGRQEEALPWFQELQALGETRELEELTAPSTHPSGEERNNRDTHTKKETSYWVDAGDVVPKLDNGSSSAETQHRPAALGNIGPFLDILSTGDNDLIPSLLQVGGTELAKPGPDDPGSSSRPDGSRLGGTDGLGSLGKFGSLAASLRASWGQEGRSPEIFGLDSDLGSSTADGGEPAEDEDNQDASFEDLLQRR